jgi:YbbR domain-containing protein
MQVPVEYRGLPAGLVIVNQHPGFVEIQIGGPRTLLSLLNPNRLAVRLDLRGVTPGETDFKLGPEMFRIPRQTSIDRILPSEIRLDIDQQVTRDVPVKVMVTGVPEDGYRISAVEVTPPVVTITGPKRDVDKMNRIETAPLDLADVGTDGARDVRLSIPSGLIRVSANHVAATVRLQEVQTYREFRAVPILVKDSYYKFRVDPRQVNILIRGPARRLAILNLAGLVYVDARGAVPGVRDVPVMVSLPDGLALVRPVPEKVKLRLFNQRAG